jgi:hypothetical protein
MVVVGERMEERRGRGRRFFEKERNMVLGSHRKGSHTTYSDGNGCV